MNQSLPDTFLSDIPQGLHILSWKQNANLSIQFSFCYLHTLSSATALQIFPDYLTLMPNAVSSFLLGWKHLHGRCYLTKPGKNHNFNRYHFILNKRTILPGFIFVLALCHLLLLCQNENSVRQSSKESSPNKIVCWLQFGLEYGSYTRVFVLFFRPSLLLLHSGTQFHVPMNEK